jgi:2-dehydro-3-deoxygalactonokinase
MLTVTIDSGTTNTRVRVWKDRRLMAQAAAPVGVRDAAIAGNRRPLSEGIKQALDQALASAGATTKDGLTVIASGMLTSNVGLCEIPHVCAPAGIDELAKGARQKVLPEIIETPIWFIPGVKNDVGQVTLDNYEAMDVMRGEECETIGAISRLNIQEPTLIILPGSHSKFVSVNEQQKIVASSTTMAGELLDVITQHTLLADSLEHGFAQHIDRRYLLKGAECYQRVGLSRSAFSVRILDLFSDASRDQKASFLLGAVLYSDIITIKNSRALNLTPTTKIVICGKKILTEALTVLIENDPFFCGEIVSFEEPSDAPLSSLGAMLIAQRIDTEQR